MVGRLGRAWAAHVGWVALFSLYSGRHGMVASVSLLALGFGLGSAWSGLARRRSLNLVTHHNGPGPCFVRPSRSPCWASAADKCQVSWGQRREADIEGPRAHAVASASAEAAGFASRACLSIRHRTGFEYSAPPYLCRCVFLLPSERRCNTR